MAEATTLPWFLESVPLLVMALMAVHVFAMMYWMYKLASQKPAPRRKTH